MYGPGPSLARVIKPMFEASRAAIDHGITVLGAKHLLLSPPVDNCRNVIEYGLMAGFYKVKDHVGFFN